jgi:hypothetical protein
MAVELGIRLACYIQTLEERTETCDTGHVFPVPKGETPWGFETKAGKVQSMGRMVLSNHNQAGRAAAGRVLREADDDQQDEDYYLEDDEEEPEQAEEGDADEDSEEAEEEEAATVVSGKATKASAKDGRKASKKARKSGGSRATKTAKTGKKQKKRAAPPDSDEEALEPQAAPKTKLLKSKPKAKSSKKNRK